VFHVPPQDKDTASCLLPMIDAIERESIARGDARAGGDALSQEDIVRCATEIVLITLERYVSRQLSSRNVWWGDRDFDPKVMRAIKLIERESAKNWTVESLAAEVGMGRSAFAMRFRELVGDTPVNCLFKTRMRLASVLIREQKSSIAAVADATGYQSESAFIKAFVRHFGITPGQYRAAAAGNTEEGGHKQSHWTAWSGTKPRRPLASYADVRDSASRSLS
jgi:AraC-like DNA-binding protein